MQAPPAAHVGGDTSGDKELSGRGMGGFFVVPCGFAGRLLVVGGTVAVAAPHFTSTPPPPTFVLWKN